MEMARLLSGTAQSVCHFSQSSSTKSQKASVAQTTAARRFSHRGSPVLTLPPGYALGHSQAVLGVSRLPRTAISCSPSACFDLPPEMFLHAALFLDLDSLLQLDAACRISRTLNLSPSGPWRALGLAEFAGLELDGEGDFGDVSTTWKRQAHGCLFDWKRRFALFKSRLATFRSPFGGRHIEYIQEADEVVYLKAMIKAHASEVSSKAIYVEISVIANPDNLSLAVVDFEAGGHSSVTFSPDTGAVIRERKVCEAPRKVQGFFLQPLRAALTEAGSGFLGTVGVYLHAGHVAFLRKSKVTKDGDEARWESTGFVTDLSWAEGRCVTPCVAFRDEGAYNVRIQSVSSTPPIPMGQPPSSYDESRWRGLDWEAGDSDEEALRA